MKTTEYKGYFIHPSKSPFYDEACGVSAFQTSKPLLFFKSIRAAKCWITRHLATK